jgi:hypothetical protein
MKRDKARTTTAAAVTAEEEDALAKPKTGTWKCPTLLIPRNWNKP